MAIYNRLKPIVFLEPASYAFIFKIFCLAWSRRPREYFCSDQMHLAPLEHSSHVHMGGFKIWPTTLFPIQIGTLHQSWTRKSTCSPANSEFHLWQSMATNSQHFPALRHLLVYELLFLFLGLEDAQDGNFGGNLPPIWAMKMSSTPNSPISCESRTGPGVAYVQTNPLLPEKKHKEHQIWETFWSQKNRKDGWI